jgi:hypothetical protein
MATAEEALSGILAEVSTSIRAREPNTTAVISAKWSRFVEHDHDDTGKSIREVTGVSRLFELDAPEEITPYCLPGYSVHFRRFRIPTTFLYYKSSRWAVAAIADIGIIRHWFLNNQGGSGVDGISSRIYPMDEIPTREIHESDPWVYYTINLDVLTTITFS